MKRKFLFFLILSLAVAPAYAKRFASGPVELEVHPAKAPEPADKYALIPRTDKLTDADAVPLYEKAIAAMVGGRRQERQIQEWLDLPPEQLPQKQVEELIQRNIETLRLVARAARYKQCNWPESDPSTTVAAMSGYRKLSFLVTLWTRLEIVRGQYDSALLAMQTGFGMARHVGRGPTTMQALVGMAIGGMMCREVELFIKGKDSPNLYWAMANLPRPFVDVGKAIESERANAKGIRNFLFRKQTKKVVDPANERILLNEKRFGNSLNVVQCVEAVRHYAATHDGQLPEKLSDITDLELPKDVVTDKPFELRRTAKGLVVTSTIPEGGDAADLTRYEVVLKK
jgi:hypothetical protein